MTEETDNGKEVSLGDTQLVRGNEFLGTHALTPYGPNKLLKEMTRRIMIFDKSKIPMVTNEAAHTAQLALSTGLNPFAGELFSWIVVKKDGRREFNWMPGYKGIVRQANEQAKEEGIRLSKSEPELLTDNEKLARNISVEDMAVKIVVRDDVEMKTYSETLKVMSDAIGAEKAYKELGPPPGTVGYGVVTKEETAELNKYSKNAMPDINRCVKRALTQGYKFKMNLQFGGAVSGELTDYSEYIKGDVVDVDFEDVTEERPFGLDPEVFGTPEDRMNPKFWNGLCKQMVNEGFARDDFVAAELLAYSMFSPKQVNEKWAVKFFKLAKEILLEDEKRPLKEIAPLAYSRLFESESEKVDRQKKVQKKPAKKTKPKAKAEAKKPTPKKTAPKKPEVKLDDAGLTTNQQIALASMALDYKRYTPKSNQDWETAYKYINLKRVATSRKEFQEVVKQMGGDVRLGMCRMLGYL